MDKTKSNGFTLIELLLVMAILGILFGSLLVGLNPTRQMAKARDTQRNSHLYGIVSAVLQYASEHSGELPDTDGDPLTYNFPTTPTCIGTSVGCFDLAGAGETGETIVPVYLDSIPVDPRPVGGVAADQTNTQYLISVDVNGRVTAEATGEISGTISVKK